MKQSSLSIVVFTINLLHLTIA